MPMFTNEVLVDGQPVGVSGTFWQATQPVSGTFWQATQPISGSVGVTGSVAVTGSFWQATQPISGTVGVSGTVTVDGSGVTQPVSGTFWQATQPVSGTFWQATQPVSGTVSVTPATSNTASVTPVVLSANTNATLLVANPARLGAILYTTDQPVYVKFGATASSTSFTYKITAKNSTIEFPTAWVGRIDILSQAGQTVHVTEF